MSIPNQVFIALVVDNFLYPLSAFRSHFSQSINWSGIRYHLKNGKISKVCPFKAKSSSITPMTDRSSHCKMCFSNIYKKMLNVGKTERTPPETAVCAGVSSLGPHSSMLLSLFSILFLKGQSKQLVFFCPQRDHA